MALEDCQLSANEVGIPLGSYAQLRLSITKGPCYGYSTPTGKNKCSGEIDLSRHTQ
jgi:hypothetical protein